MTDAFLIDPRLPASLARVATRQDLDRLEREIAREIGAAQPPAPASRARPAGLVRRGAAPAVDFLAPAFVGHAGDLIEGDALTGPSAPIDDALRQAQATFGAALEATGLSPQAVALLQAWVDMTADTRALQQQIALKRAELAHAEQSVAGQGAPAAPRAVTTGDPLAPLSAAEIGQALGLHEQSVRTRERAGQLFSILRSGRKRGQEFPAFQAWPGVAGEPLERTLAALVAPGTTGPVSGTLAYGFLTSPTDLLGDLSPLEVLLGRQLAPRPLEAQARARDVLASSATDRLDLVLETARTVAGSENT